MQKPKEYFVMNSLMVKPRKTQCIFIGSRQLMAQIPDNISIGFDGRSIFSSTLVKKLGLHMDRYMVFDTHINDFTKKVISTLSCRHSKAPATSFECLQDDVVHMCV